MSFRPLIRLSLTLLGLASTPALAAERPVVIELFTSQGCSSCPPANAFLNDLARGRRDVLPLAFHVTYWDRLGWKDPFSLAAATDRQAGYGARFGDGSYTPEIVVDGKSGHVGSRRDEVEAAIASAKAAALPAPALQLTRNNAQLVIDVGSGTGGGRLLLIGFDHRHETAIRRGENGGRTFEELNVVRSIRPIADWSGASRRLTESVPDAEDAAVLLEAPDGRIIAAARL